MDLRYTTALAETNTCDAPPSAGTLGIENARLIAPGHPETSVLVQRMSRRDQHGMPPVGSARSDTDGVALITEWVQSLSACP